MKLELDKPLQSILVTSAAPGEGKSTVTANLAVTLAQAGQNVCLIDCDLRRPTLHRLFGVTHRFGLTTVLIGENTLEDVLQGTGVPGVTLLASGPIPPNPAELLGSNQMASLLANLEQRFDMVLVDAPPVLAVADASVLARRVGGVVLVVRAGRTPRQQVAQAQSALAMAQARILGAVLTAARPEVHTGYYYYSYDYRRENRRKPR